MTDIITTNNQSLLSEANADLKANGWNNGKITTALRIIFLGLNFQTLFLYRLQVRLNKIPLVGTILRRILAWFTCILTSCEISSHAIIEGGITMPHPNGIVIGEGCIIKSGVTIYQHVTIGTRAGNKSNKQYPIIEPNVTIYTGAVIAGGHRIGANATIGANAVVIDEVPENATAVGVPAKII